MASFAATNLKVGLLDSRRSVIAEGSPLQGTKLPVPAVGEAAPSQPKTFPHAIARASEAAALAVGPNERLGKALADYTTAFQKVSTQSTYGVYMLITHDFLRSERRALFKTTRSS